MGIKARVTLCLSKHRVLKMTAGMHGQNTDEPQTLNLCFLSHSVCFLNRAPGCIHKREPWCSTENRNSFSHSIYFSPGHLVWNYISTIYYVARETSSVVGYLVGLITQSSLPKCLMLQFQIMLSQLGTARQESSQVGVSHFCLSSSPYFSKKDHLCNVAISGLTVLYRISQSKKWKNTGMKGAQHKYTDNNLCIVNRWEV